MHFIEIGNKASNNRVRCYKIKFLKKVTRSCLLQHDLLEKYTLKISCKFITRLLNNYKIDFPHYTIIMDTREDQYK